MHTAIDYHRMFDAVGAHLTRIGQSYELKKRAPLGAAELSQAEERLRFVLPASLHALYATYANGFLFRWSAPGEKGAFTMIAFPTLAELGKTQRAWLDEWPHADDEPFEFTDDPALARRTAERMKQWLPVLAEGNGDVLCIDLGSTSQRAVFHQHDWFDGGTGDNGHVLGESWDAFFEAWSRVCFQFPSTLWWPDAFRKKSGIDWDGPRFDKRYRLA